MTTSAISSSGGSQDQTKPTIQKWNLASIAVIAFAVGAVLTNFMMRNVFEKPLRVGATEYKYFSDDEVSRAFQKQFAMRYAASGGAKWMGVQTTQNPLDLWVSQEIITEIQPDVIIETGTGHGGSALAYATVLDRVNNKGHVETVDIHAEPGLPAHPRISYHTGSSTDPAVFNTIRSKIQTGQRVMVVLDSFHERPHVANELKLYAPLVSVGSYLVVHGTQLHGHPLEPIGELRPGAEGPYEAVESFLAENSGFEVDRSRERFGVTANPMGWLKRVR